MNRSLFIKNQFTNRVHELAVYGVTSSFPLPYKYVVLNMDNGRKGYLPLNVVGADYDSGLRFTETATGEVYQVCSKAQVDVFREIIHAENLVILCDNTASLYAALRTVFEERVALADDRESVSLRAPHRFSGVSKMLLVGAYLGVTVEADNATFDTHFNGLNMSQVGGDQSYIARTMLLGLAQPNVYHFFVEGGDIRATLTRRIVRLEKLFSLNIPTGVSDGELHLRVCALAQRFEDVQPPSEVTLDAIATCVADLERHWAKINNINMAKYMRLWGVEFGFPVVNAIIIGRDVEKLPAQSASYASLLELPTSAFAVYRDGEIQRTLLSQQAVDDLEFVRTQLLSYAGSRQTYNYYALSKVGRVAS